MPADWFRHFALPGWFGLPIAGAFVFARIVGRVRALHRLQRIDLIHAHDGNGVLLGCLATRFPKTTLQFDAANLKFTNSKEANAFVHKKYRKGWEVEGL